MVLHEINLLTLILYQEVFFDVFGHGELCQEHNIELQSQNSYGQRTKNVSVQTRGPQLEKLSMQFIILEEDTYTIWLL